MSGLDLLRRLADAGLQLPSIMITGDSDVSMAVQAMKAGASDFIEKPVGHSELLASIERALEQGRDSSKRLAWHQAACDNIADLTPRERQIMEMVLAGDPSKNIAADLGISQRTVENHRASIMKKTGARSLPALARLAIAAAAQDGDGHGVGEAVRSVSAGADRDHRRKAIAGRWGPNRRTAVRTPCFRLPWQGPRLRASSAIPEVSRWRRRP